LTMMVILGEMETICPWRLIFHLDSHIL
jgi:hypothetical protein